MNVQINHMKVSFAWYNLHIMMKNFKRCIIMFLTWFRFLVMIFLIEKNKIFIMIFLGRWYLKIKILSRYSMGLWEVGTVMLDGCSVITASTFKIFLIHKNSISKFTIVIKHQNNKRKSHNWAFQSFGVNIVKIIKCKIKIRRKSFSLKIGVNDPYLKIC